MEDTTSFLYFLHSLLRYLVLFSLLAAIVISWRGVLEKRPILVYERMITILAMVLCHVQLLVGLILYMTRWKYISKVLNGRMLTFWKYEHLSMMLLAIALVTAGRLLSKRARFEGSKQLLIAVFYTAGLLLMLWAIPWPFTTLGEGRGWL